MKKLKKAVAIMMAGGMVMMGTVPSQASWFGGKKAAAETTAPAKTEYAMTYKDTEIRLNQEAAPILKALGDCTKSFEQQSCAYQGMDRIYTYAGMEIGTYPVKNKDYISSIYFLDNTVSTQEGIKIGSTYDEMVKAYGTGYKEEFGVYRYTLGKTELIIYTTKKIVDAIEYQVIPE